MDDASPTAPKRLCLNMIVRNETANLPRCLDAVAPHIACWVIGDTGSTDGTQDFIRAYFAERGIPGELHSFPFVNFEQARNAALDHAYASPLPYDYLLFDDADMELIVDDPAFRTRLDAPGYQVIQKAGSGLVYWNTRIVRREIGARYRGVTHEYLDVPGGTQRLNGVWYKDHASGSNRTDKFDRDARLLSEALEKDPDNHRTWFYLAQSYRDGGKTKEAAEAYAKRATMGGWDEEAWNARLQEARCLRTLGDDAGFIRAALQAFNQRPSRAEPLYDLARYYREHGMNDASVLFSEPGLAIPRPDQDILFIEDFVYSSGLREEYSISANYSRDPARKDRGHAACDWLALSRDTPVGTRNLARSNLFFYAEPLSAMAPSFLAKRIAFDPPEGWRALNPSVARWGDRLVAVLRTVNYELRDDGHYVTFDGSPITTRNYLLRLNDALEIESSAEILPPADWPPPQYQLVRGFEDPRLFVWHDALWCTATVRDQTPEGWCEQVLARIDCPPIGPCRLTDWRMLRPEGERLHEKNWMPLVDGDVLRFIYLCDPTQVVDDTARTVAESVPPIAADEFKGGSQAIAFDGGWLALIHEVIEHGGKRRYQHRFVWFDAENTLKKVSRRFYFAESGIEFAAGLAWHPDNQQFLISHGIGDNQAWLATVNAEEVRAALSDPTMVLHTHQREGLTYAPTITTTHTTHSRIARPRLLPEMTPIPTANARHVSASSNTTPVRPSIAAMHAGTTLVSVITPTRNREQFLKNALVYFQSQDYPNIEWHILDDSRTATTVFNGVADERIFYEHTEKQIPIGDKRNRLIENANGDIIVHFDDDDYYAPGFVSAMVSALTDQNADLINLRGWFLYDMRSQFFGYWDLMQKEGLHYRCDRGGITTTNLTPENNAAFAENHLGYGFSYAFRKSVWNLSKFPAINLGEDQQFAQKAGAQFKLGGLHDTKGLCLHILHPASTSCCLPQYHLPRFMLKELFPSFNCAASDASRIVHATSPEGINVAVPKIETPDPNRCQDEGLPNVKRIGGTVVSTTIRGVPVKFGSSLFGVD